MKTLTLTLALVVAAVLSTSSMAQEPMATDGDYEVIDGGVPMNGDYSGYGMYYYHTSWGRPVAMVLPPVARMHYSYGRTVGSATVNAIYPQYAGPNYSYDMVDGETGMYRPTPYWPTSTSQFGVYYVRGPW